MNFSQVAKLFDMIESTSSRIEKTDLLAQCLKTMSAHEAQIISYLSMADLHAPYRNIQFNMAEKSLIEAISVLLDKSSTTVMQWYKDRGDLGDVIQDYWRTDTIDKELSIEQVYADLITCAQLSGTGSIELKCNYLVALLHKVDVCSAKYIIRIITKTLRLGFSDMTLLDAFSCMAVGDKSIRVQLENAYNVCADLGLVAKTLKEGGVEAVQHMKPIVGIPIRPSAAERLANSQAVIDKLGVCVAQPKLDGFRLQIHVDKTGDDPIVKFYSRNLVDMSSMFPDLKEQIIQLNVRNMICEGEAIGYDEQTQTFMQFQETVKRKRKHNIEQASQDIPLRFYAFDLLYINDESMLGTSHVERRMKLGLMIESLKVSDIFLIDEQVVSTGQELENYFLQTIGAGLEGLVVKKQEAVYQPGKRNFNWIKLKRQIGQKLGDTIDTVVLGYYFGQGRRTYLGIGACLVGVYNPQTDAFESVAKVGTGMSDLEWIDLKVRCDAVQVPDKLDYVHVAKSLYPDVWVEPNIVCEIRADDITQSPLHTACKTDGNLGFALRFPRFVQYRIDKSAQDTTNAQELAHLYDIQYQ